MIQRTSGGSDALVPEPLSAEIIQEMPKHSAAMQLMRHMPLSSKTQRLPVLDVLPVAYFVATGVDSGLKQTAQQAWKNVNLVVEEVATIVPIPESYMADADVPIWDEVRPRLTEAAGALVDAAVFWGVNRPSTWGVDLFTAATGSGNVVKDGYLDNGGGTTQPADDFGQSIASLGDYMSQTGYTVNGFAARPGLQWRLRGLRSAQGVPIYQSNMQEGGASNLYGFPLPEVDNGSWDATKAQVICGDWTKAILGIRSDISTKIFTEGVISDNSGNVVLNLMQQDSIALRMTMRLAFAVANPVTIMQKTKTIEQRFPFGLIAT
jgi:HK97 family phage major capsid protein